MSEFSASGISGLPPLSSDSLQYGDPRVLGWLLEAISEGDRLNQADPSYQHIERAQRYVSGEQLQTPTTKLPYLPQITINESRKVVQAHVSALTDLKPLFGYKASNPTFEFQAQLLNQLTIAWWTTIMADLALGDCIKYALAGGTGDLKVEWDPHAGLHGNHALIACDARDTLAVRPTSQPNPQLWEGCVFREAHTVNVLRGMFPTKAHLFQATADSLLGTLMGKMKATASRLISPATDTLSGLGSQTHDKKPTAGQVLLYRCYLTDRSRNLTSKPIPVGDPTTNWGYTVQPGELMYPRRRLIVATPTAVIFDGPNPYWHGMIPFARLKPWSLPWQFMGSSLLNDLLPIQDAINQTANDIQLGLQQWLNPQTLYDRSAVSESMMRQYDPRRPGTKVKLNPTGGEGFKRLEGPPPQVLSLAADFLGQLTAKFNDLSGTANLLQLMELRQMPGADTIQRYYEALTPELRQEGRMVEAFLRDVGEMTKCNTFQFMSAAQRVNILGDAGITLQDFDYDPDSLVPALQPFTPTGEDTPGYTPELDAKVPRDKRAQYFHKQFVFTIAPNSILAMNAQEQKLLRLQLARMGFYDFWSLMESLEIPNIGTPPKMPLDPLGDPDPAEVQNDLLAQAGMVIDPQTGTPIPNPASMGMPAPAQKYILDPMGSGQIKELRPPQTVTERLMAQQLLGIGGTENPAASGVGAEGGRPPSGGSSPQSETKTDQYGVPRQTTTESQPSRNGQQSNNPAAGG